MSYKKALAKFVKNQKITPLEVVNFIIGKGHSCPPNAEEMTELIAIIQDDTLDSKEPFKIEPGDISDITFETLKFEIASFDGVTKANLRLLWDMVMKRHQHEMEKKSNT